MRRISALLFTIAVALVWTGCSTPQGRIGQNPDEFKQLSPLDQALIKQGRVAYGFTPAMVKLALGEPKRVEHPAADQEVWIYEQAPPPSAQGKSKGSHDQDLLARYAAPIQSVTFQGGKVIDYK